MESVVKNALLDYRQKKIDFLNAQIDLDLVQENIETQLKNSLDQILVPLSDSQRQRVFAEIQHWGAIQSLSEDRTINEIIITSPNDIYYEKNGCWFRHSDSFLDLESYDQFVERLAQQCHSHLCFERPFIEKKINHFRLTVVFKHLGHGHHQISLRQQTESEWSLEKLQDLGWANASEIQTLKKIIHQPSNFIVVGGTSSGKTAVLQALLEQIPHDQRLVVLEDTAELKSKSGLNTHLLTHYNSAAPHQSVTLRDLLIRTLRLRPDRIIVGEIRGDEATQLLLALATGHIGSFGSLHAQTAQEALLRLEMLIQMGAPQWSSTTIRQLIRQTLHYIIVVKKENGRRQLEGIYQISSLENNGFCLEKIEN